MKETVASVNLADELRELLRHWPLQGGDVEYYVHQLLQFVAARSRRTRQICRYVVDVAQELLDALDIHDTEFKLEQERAELQNAVNLLRQRLDGFPEPEVPAAGRDTWAFYK